MKIGVDIDDTISETNDRLISEAIKYDRECCRGKGIKDPDAESFLDMFYWNVVELDNFFNIIRKGDFYSTVVPVKDAPSYVSQLHKEGHKIIFITKRTDNFKTKRMTKKWLKKYGFDYDKLIMGCSKKGEKCKELGIDLLIDNDKKNIKTALEYGVNGILRGDKYNDTDKYTRIEEWSDIYKYISKGR